MTGNQLKWIACLSMLIDHVGYLLFPDVLILRCIGRLAMPLFAYFIAEGCRYTRSKSKYFIKVFSLAVFCQLIYVLSDVINGTFTGLQLNVLFTFALSIVVCSAYLRLKDSLESSDGSRPWINGVWFALSLALVIVCCIRLTAWVGMTVHFDYGIAGALLPLFAVLFADKKRQIVFFAVGVTAFNIALYADIACTWFSLLAIPLLICYNGTRGNKKWQPFFYWFYPAHFAVLYLIQTLAF